MSAAARILVVDDFWAMRRSVRHLLHELGYVDVAEADDGSTALPLLQAGGFACLVTDWHMPGMRGIELRRRVRADPQQAKLPVLMVTAEASDEQLTEAARAGVSACLVKPFTAANLKEQLDLILGVQVAAG